MNELVSEGTIVYRYISMEEFLLLDKKKAEADIKT